MQRLFQMRKRSAFVTNKKLAKEASSEIQMLVINLVPAQTRIETLEGRQYKVVPMVMLTEGVHQGSSGPLFYPKDELGKTPAVWNHKPVVVYHPELNGKGISACDPDVINNRKVGIIMNTKFDDSTGRLKAEAWIEESRANAVDERIMQAVERNEMMELSTGVFIDVDDTAGKWGAEDYSGIARNYRPDHLALLPDKVGACSIQDGAGFIRNQNGLENQVLNEVAKNLGLSTKPTPTDYLLYKIGKRLGLVDNEMSHSNIADSLRTVLHKRLKLGEDKWIWIADVYSNFFIYEQDGKLFRLGYESSDTGVSLSEDDPVEVKRVTEYRTVEGAFVGNQDHQKDNTNMDKAKMIIAILAANAGWTEKDKPTLEAMSDAQVNTICQAVTKPAAGSAAPAANTAPEGSAPPASGATPPPAAAAAQPPAVGTTSVTANQNPPAQPLTVEQYIAGAPAGVQEVLRNSMEALNTEKGQLVDAITKNSNNPYTKEQLEHKPLSELRNLARLAGTVAAPRNANYSGAGVPASEFAANEGEEPLELPTTNAPTAKA